jgi:hypothetical protein
VKGILKFARKSFDIDKYLPEYKKLKKPDRSWLCNVGKSPVQVTSEIVNTLVPKKFKKFIDEAMIERESELVAKKSMEVKALPEFAQLFKESHHVSCKCFKRSLICI